MHLSSNEVWSSLSKIRYHILAQEKVPDDEWDDLMNTITTLLVEREVMLMDNADLRKRMLSEVADEVADKKPRNLLNRKKTDNA